MIFWIPSIVFLLVSGLALLGAFVWMQRYSPQAKAKTQRLQDIETYLAGQAGRSRRRRSHGLLAVDRWMREHVPPYNQLDDLLARANSHRSALQVLGMCLATALATFVVAGMAGTGFWLALLLGVVFSSGPVLFLFRAAVVRRGKFENKLPEALDFITARCGRVTASLWPWAWRPMSCPIRLAPSSASFLTKSVLASPSMNR